MQANKKTGAGGVLLLFFLLAIGSLIFFGQLNKGLPIFFNWGKPDPLTQTIELIKTRYVDNIPLDSLEGLSLDSMIGRLDPHSAYLSPTQLKTANEDLAGHFAGIGIEFNLIRDTVTVAFLMPNSPCVKTGIQVGDQLLAVGEKSLVGKGIDADSIRSLVRGPAGSLADLTIRSKGQMRKVSIKRSDIPTPAVAVSYLMNDTTGYIQLAKFSEGSYRETVQALESLVSNGIKALVLDLRSNGGGFMHEAVELADEFLADNRLIVYTEGAHQPKRSYSCKRPGLFEKGKLTILMNEYSASASEVLAGALQDWCRATVVGRKSFGKGLVQEQYDLSNGGALRLTVARYYTPLGRCIQRPYFRNKRTDRQEQNHEEQQSHPASIKTYFNNCGDSLFANGGIFPDVFVPKEESTLSKEGNALLNTPEIIQWAYQFYQLNKKEIDAIPDLTIPAETSPLSKIRSFFENQPYFNAPVGNDITESDWNRIGFEFYAQIARFAKGTSEYARVIHLRDPFVKAALAHGSNSSK